MSMSLLALTTTGVMPPSFSQEQAIFQDERLLQMDNAHQANQLQNQENQYEQGMETKEAKDEPYKLYAEKRVAELLKLKSAGGSPARSYAKQTGELYALQSWLSKDAATQEDEMAHIKNLDKAIANLRDSEHMDQGNLQNDVQAMREDEIAKQSDDAFNKMMQINQFNELQSEMGAASWGRPPTDGTFNSTGGYGMGGGYGYSPMMGRRW
jgi:hypothetical protein